MDRLLRSLVFVTAALALESADAAPATVPRTAPASTAVAVTTYHYDARRTGWNSRETVLSAASFPATFGVLQTIPLDDQVDAQPLFVPGLAIAGGTHDVVYVVTENNSLYAIDAHTGSVLLRRHFGTPVPTPLGCGNNGPNVGITSTPVIDLTTRRLYLIAYVNGTSGSPPSYQLHAVHLGSLADAVAPVTVSAVQTLTDGSTFTFNASYQRQRPGLLEMNGVIYAGFGSFCDFSADQSRGWVLGWSASTLAPLTHAELNDTQATSPTSFFLSSVWMSGFGLASNGTRLFFSTGNSDCNFYVSPTACPSQTTYDGVTNLQESVVSLDPTLASRSGIFTPSDVYQMDVNDADLGAAGVMLVPPLKSGANLATIVSKDGRLWLLDQNNLANSLDMQQLPDGCWCGPSHFVGADGIHRIVSSGGDTVETWQIRPSPAPHLAAEATGFVQQTIQDPGFFTSVSSNGVATGTAIIWAVARPTSSTGLTLYAFDATASRGSLRKLYSSPAGQWPNLGGNATTVPVVANGQVYVAAYGTLMIFGPNGTAVPASAPLVLPASLPSGVTRRVTGTLLAVEGQTLTLQTRAGRLQHVDGSFAAEHRRLAALIIGHAYTALGTNGASAADVSAVAVMRAKLAAAAWPEDR